LSPLSALIPEPVSTTSFFIIACLVRYKFNDFIAILEVLYLNIDKHPPDADKEASLYKVLIVLPAQDPFV
jgi:hypothetical protein